MSYSIEDIKRDHSVIRYAQDHGLPVRKEKDRTASFIEPGNRKDCVVYYRDWWYDFKTRQGGDVIDLAALLEFDGDKGQAIRSLGGVGEEWVKKTQNICNEIELWHKNLKHKEYLTDRGITEATIEELKIGENRNRIIIPYFKNGYVCNWIGRTLKEVTDKNPKYLKAKKEGVIQSIPWGLNTLGKTDSLIITEGAFDALSVYQEGYSVLATMGGWFTKEQLKTVRAAVTSHKNTFLMFDSDEAGQNFAHSLASHLFKHHITRFYVCNIPTGFKDVSEYYEKNGEIEGILEESVDSLDYLTRDLDRDALKQFLFKAVRFVGVEEINLLFPKLQRTHDQEWLKELQKLILKMPPQSMVADEVLNEHNLVYSEKSDFYEFDDSRWVNRTDTEIKAYIDKTLGNFTSNAAVNSILGLVKARSNANMTFNKKHLMNFKNGTLELDTGKFRAHNPNDNLTIQADYDYNPNAGCSAFQDFLIDITNNVPEKIRLLQEIFGYVMFPENTLQKCAYFIGKGSNGKSVLLNIIQRLYGEDSVSNVDVSSLVSEFQRIQLKDSMVNIAPDIKADMKQSEDYFKRVIAGDPINGCYKGKDFIQFKPHAKFIISANEFIRPNDTSYGMERRMLFVEFPIRFVDNPQREDERQIDLNIEKKLLEELPGIFNWAYVGYKRLLENQKFTETQEQKRLLESFRSEINPIYAFCKEFLVDKTEFTIDQAYDEFNANFGFRLAGRMTKRGFSMKISGEMSKEYPEWKKFRRENLRGYRLQNAN